MKNNPTVQPEESTPVRSLSPEDIQAMLNIKSLRTVYAWLECAEKENLFPIKRLGPRIIRVPEKAFLQWYES